MKYLFYSLSLAIVISSCSNKQEKEFKPLLFPVIGAVKVINGDTVYHTIAPFSFTNQFRETITDTVTKDKIYIANFFFATCQSICPRMNTLLGRVQDVYKNDKEVLFLSHTVNPINDTVEVLAQYGAKYGAIKGKWHLLTGSKKALYNLAKTSYLINAVEDDNSDEGFIHSEFLLLIDKQKRIRGTYDGTDSIMVNKLIDDVKLLKTEKQ